MPTMISMSYFFLAGMNDKNTAYKFSGFFYQKVSAIYPKISSAFEVMDRVAELAVSVVEP
jgi:hypothetical protein